MVEKRFMKQHLGIGLILAIAFTLIAIPALARPPKDFHDGPYLVLEGGAWQSDFDTDQVTGQSVANDWEPTVGFVFGWNIYDWFSTELQGKYTTDKNSGRRVHIASGNVYAKFTLIADALTDFPSFRILPFLKAGMGFRASVLPSTPAASNPDDSKTQIGFGPSVGGGIAFLWKKYFYFGIDVQEDLYLYDDIRETVSGVPNTLVYKGGFHPSFCGMGFVGVHY